MLYIVLKTETLSLTILESQYVIGIQRRALVIIFTNIKYIKKNPPRSNQTVPTNNNLLLFIFTPFFFYLWIMFDAFLSIRSYKVVSYMHLIFNIFFWNIYQVSYTLCMFYENMYNVLVFSSTYTQHFEFHKLKLNLWYSKQGYFQQCWKLKTEKEFRHNVKIVHFL